MTKVRQWCWSIALFFQLGAMDRLLSGYDPTLVEQVTTGLPRYIRYGLSAIAILVLMIEYRRSQFSWRTWPAWALITLALPISITGPLPSWTIVQYFAVFSLAAFCFCLIAANGRQSALVYFNALTLVVFISALTSIFLPEVGTIVPGSRTVGDPGSWIGLLGEKNLLGPAAGLLLGLSLTSINLPVNSLYKVVAALVSALCLIFAKSGSGILIGLATIVLGTAFVFFRSGYRSYFRIIAFSIVLISSPILVSNLNLILDPLGKDLTFTGRTSIWEEGFRYAYQFFPEGAGSGFCTSAETIAYVTARFKLTHFHSAYLGWMIDYGLIGIVASLSLLVLFVLSCIVPKSRGFRSTKDFFGLVLFCCILDGFTETAFANSAGIITCSLFIGVFGLLSKD